MQNMRMPMILNLMFALWVFYYTAMPEANKPVWLIEGITSIKSINGNGMFFETGIMLISNITQALQETKW